MQKNRKNKKRLLAEWEDAKRIKVAEIEQQFRELDKYIEANGLEKVFQLESIEEFTRQKLSEWNRQPPIIVTGKYRDYSKVETTFQQKFVEYTRQLAPEVFEELLPLVPEFDQLFGNNKDNYHSIFNSYKMDLLNAYFAFRDSINNSIIKDPYFTYHPSVGNNFDHSFTWGEYKTLLNVLYVRNGIEDRSLYTDTIAQIVRDNIVINLFDLKIPDNFDRSVLENIVETIAKNVAQELIWNEEKFGFEYTVERNLTTFMEESEIPADEGIPVFLKLQTSLLQWAERNRLTKDWLIRYAYFFLSSFSKAPETPVGEIEVPALSTRSLAGYPFNFKFNGWLAGDESKEEYEERISSSFENELEKYFQIVARDFRLDSAVRVTKPFNYDRVKWLVRWTVQGWPKERILEEIELDTRTDQIGKEYDKNYLDKAFSQFKDYDLPVRTPIAEKSFLKFQ